MRFLVLKAFLNLVVFDFCLARGNFEALYDKVRRYPTTRRIGADEAVPRICAAVDFACIWYWKEVLCLQRAAATTCLLKKCGVSAQMVIGAQHMPFKGHAWVEIDGNVINDKPYIRDIYAVLDRC